MRLGMALASGLVEVIKASGEFGDTVSFGNSGGRGVEATTISSAKRKDGAPIDGR
jgi:hypothetical protein